MLLPMAESSLPIREGSWGARCRFSASCPETAHSLDGTSDHGNLGNSLTRRRLLSLVRGAHLL